MISEQPPNFINGSEEREGNKRREIETFVESEYDKDVSPERAHELHKELVTVADFLQENGIDFYVAGGSGLDLLDGKWDRDHQDLDVQIFSRDRGQFYDVAIAAGFLITDPERKQLKKVEILDEDRENAFLFRSDDHGVVQFEVIYLAESEGEVQLRDNVSVPLKLFEQTPRTQIDGRDIRLQPPEVILFYKLLDGRRKDLKDIQTTLAQLSDEQKANLEDIISRAGLKFLVGDKSPSSMTELLQLASQADVVKRENFFTKKLVTIESELVAELMKTAEDIYKVREGAKSRDNFVKALVEKYEGFMPERRAIIEQMTEQLFEEPQPSLEDFKQWAHGLVQSQITERVKQKVLADYKNEHLWEIQKAEAQ